MDFSQNCDKFSLKSPNCLNKAKRSEFFGFRELIAIMALKNQYSLDFYCFVFCVKPAFYGTKAGQKMKVQL